MTTIKINRQSLIKTLTEKVKEMEKNNAIFEKEDKAYRAAYAKWEQECGVVALKNIKKGTLSVSTWGRQDTLNLSLPSGTLPAAPDHRTSVTFTHGHELTELRQFIKMLELSDSDTISMSALKSVSKYL